MEPRTSEMYKLKVTSQTLSLPEIIWKQTANKISSTEMSSNATEFIWNDNTFTHKVVTSIGKF